VVVVAVGFLVDGGEGAEEQVAGVGHDSSTARSDAVVGLEKEESRKESVEVRGGGEFGELAGEVAGEIGGMAFFLAQLGMPEAEMRLLPTLPSNTPNIFSAYWSDPINFSIAFRLFSSSLRIA
jgi:hypothetical protein